MTLRLDAIDFRYTAATPTIQGACHVAPGSFTAILGPNGAGKSTLLKLMAGLLRPQHGTVSWRDRALAQWPARERAQQLAYVPQITTCPFPLRVREVVALGRTPYQHGLRWEDRADQRAIDAALANMDLTALAARPIQTLSGGEWQRTCIARALAGEPQLLLLDEPLAHLDLAHQITLMELLRTRQAAGLSICCALHDINLAARYGDHVILVEHGQISATGSPRNILDPTRLSAVYGTTLQWGEALIPTGPIT